MVAGAELVGKAELRIGDEVADPLLEPLLGEAHAAPHVVEVHAHLACLRPREVPAIVTTQGAKLPCGLV